MVYQNNLFLLEETDAYANQPNHIVYILTVVIKVILYASFLESMTNFKRCKRCLNFHYQLTFMLVGWLVILIEHNINRTPQ